MMTADTKELLRFVLAILDAHGNMISTHEAAIAIEKEFEKYVVTKLTHKAGKQ